MEFWRCNWYLTKSITKTPHGWRCFSFINVSMFWIHDMVFRRRRRILSPTLHILLFCLLGVHYYLLFFLPFLFHSMFTTTLFTLLFISLDERFLYLNHVIDPSPVLLFWCLRKSKCYNAKIVFWVHMIVDEFVSI